MDTQPTTPPVPPSDPTPAVEPPAYGYAQPGRERRRTLTRLAVAGGVAALGLTIGGIAVATADDHGDRSPGRFSIGDGPFGDELAERLADSLGLEEDQVADALDDVREELAPERAERPDLGDGEWPAPPTEEEIEERQDALAAALAEALDVDAADVEAALEEIRSDLEATMEERLAEVREQFRADLVDRLDAAVDDGTLTEADKQSVLKAYDEGLLDGPGGFGHHLRFGWGHLGAPRES